MWVVAVGEGGDVVLIRIKSRSMRFYVTFQHRLRPEFPWGIFIAPTVVSTLDRFGGFCFFFFFFEINVLLYK